MKALRPVGGRSRPRVWRLRIGALAVVFCLAAASFYAASYVTERRWISTRAAEVVRSAGAETRGQEIRALQAYVRNAVDYDGAPYESRPFLRSTARETLELGLGFCGEATRAFIALARARNIPAQRMNLHGQLNHVVPEVELSPGEWVLVDIQESPITNPILDHRWATVEQVVGVPGSPFVDFSNVNVRRFPVLGAVVTRVKLADPRLAWVLESPQLMKAILFGCFALLLLGILVVDRLLFRMYRNG